MYEESTARCANVSLDRKYEQLRSYLKKFQTLFNMVSQLQIEKENQRLKYFKGDGASKGGAACQGVEEEQRKLLSLPNERNRTIEQPRVTEADLNRKIFEFQSKIELLLNRLEQGNISLEE